MTEIVRRFRVVADTSFHNLPIGMIVVPANPPDWSDDDFWFEMESIVSEPVAINLNDLEEI